MIRKMFIMSFVAVVIFTCACGDDAVTLEPAPMEYIIKDYIDNDVNDVDLFKVVEIHGKISQPVPAVKELGGLYYLPVMSRMPSFYNKVVEGEFYMDQPLGSPKPDTVFRVTKHLRDTLITN